MRNGIRDQAGQGTQALRRNGDLPLHRNRYPALAQADRTDDALAADNVSIRFGGVQGIDVALALALGALLIRAREG